MNRAVIDQPGPRIVVIGFILALGLGLGLKSQISPLHVQAQLQKAVTRLEKDFMIDFDEAHVNLSSWGLPWPRLEINRVRLSPKKNNCQSSQVFIDQIEVPISLTALLFSQNVVDTIRAHNVELRVADLTNCIVENAPPAKVITELPDKILNQPVKSVTASTEENIFQRKTSSQLKYIHIDQMKIVLKDHYLQPIVLRQLSFNLDYSLENLSQVRVKSRVVAVNDSKADVFYLVADLNADVRALQKNDFEIELTLKGRMLDGDLQILGQFNSITKNLTYELKMNKVSAKAFLPLVEKNKFDTILDKWPINLSLELTGKTTGQQSQLKVSKIALKGDRTDISSSPVDFELNNEDIIVRPFSVRVDRLPLNQLKNLPDFKNDLNSFEDLGDLTGQVVFKDPENWKMNGELLNTYLIFSNRGTRELQKIDSIQFNSSHKNKRYDLMLTAFVVNDQKIEGDLEAHFDERNNSLIAKMNLSGRLLSPKIWKQLTQVQQNPELKMSWDYQKMADLRQQIFLSASELQFEGFNLKDLQIDYIQASAAEDTQSIVLNLKAKEAKIVVSELNFAAATGLFNETSGLLASSYDARKLHLSLKGASWKSMVFDFDFNLANPEDPKENAQLKAKGQWKNVDTLSASATLQTGQRLIEYDVTKSAQNEIMLTPVKQ